MNRMKVGLILECGPEGADKKVCEYIVRHYAPEMKIDSITLDDKRNIGVPDEYRGEIVKAFVVLKPGAQATEDELKEHCHTRLARYKWPGHIVITDSLPKSAVGKVLRRVLREQELAQRS